MHLRITSIVHKLAREAAKGLALQCFVGVEVLAGGFDVAVTHQLLDGDDIAARLKVPGGIGMPEFVLCGQYNTLTC